MRDTKKGSRWGTSEFPFKPLPFNRDLHAYVSTCCHAGSMVRDSYEWIPTCDLRVSVLIQSYKKGSRLGHQGISGPTYCLSSCSSVVRALVCQPSGPGSILAVSLKSAYYKKLMLRPTITIQT